ncbi:hypothetical protein ACROYT_G014647 [Oculina patagonica]
MMALPFLPPKKIKQSFQKLKRKVTSDALKKFAKYVEETWINSTTWPPKSWSVYMQSIRTNNDVEGWHNGLNRRAQGKSQLPLYMLITLLHEESRLTTLQIRMVSKQPVGSAQKRGKDSQAAADGVLQAARTTHRVVTCDFVALSHKKTARLGATKYIKVMINNWLHLSKSDGTVYDSAVRRVVSVALDEKHSHLCCLQECKRTQTFYAANKV